MSAAAPGCSAPAGLPPGRGVQSGVITGSHAGISTFCLRSFAAPRTIQKLYGGADGMIGGFIGLGAKGRNVALNIRRAGFDMVVHDVRPER